MTDDTPLPDDVAEAVDGLRALANEHGACDEFANMLKRLWRENKLLTFRNGDLRNLVKERQIKARISALRLEEQGLSNLLNDTKMQKIIAIR